MRIALLTSLAFAFSLSTAGCLNFECDNNDFRCQSDFQLGYLAALQPCNVDYFNAGQPIRGAFYLQSLRAQAALGASGSATASTFPSPVAGTQKWLGGVLAPNGLIYGIPNATPQILVIDPATDTATTISGPGAGADDWFGGVLGADGKIYAIPRNNDQILVIDPVTNTTSTIASPVTGGGGAKWRGGVLAPNGKIYSAPAAGPATDILVIDPATQTATTMPSPTTDLFSPVLAPNGKIYALPRVGATTPVVVIDPLTETSYTIAHNVDGEWIGGVLAPNGIIYAVPDNGPNILMIDPATDTVTSIPAPVNGAERRSLRMA